jgi:hypothetical protein
LFSHETTNLEVKAHAQVLFFSKLIIVDVYAVVCDEGVLSCNHEGHVRM